MRKTIHAMSLVFTLMFPLFVELASAAAITGRVSGESVGRGVALARLRLLRLSSPLDERFTDTFGRFEFTGLAAGRYTIEVEAPGFVSTAVEATAGDSHQTVFMLIELRPVRPPTTNLAPSVSVSEYLIPNAARRDFERGTKRQRESKCNDALEYFEKAVRAYPRYTAAHNEMGNCLVRLGMLDRAEDSFKRAVALATTVYPSMNLADVYLQQKRFDEARAVLNRAISSHPNEGDAYYSLALAYLAEGRSDDAEHAALQADSRRHSVADLHLLLARIYMEKQNPAEAVKQLTTFLKEAPRHPAAQQVRNDLRKIRP
jgi:tetratricopeptide (TPR) repeat protein